MTDLAEALSRGGVGDPNKYKLKCSNTSFLWNTVNSSKFCNTSSWVRGGGNNDQHRNQLLALLEKLLQTQRAGSPAVLCVCAESTRSPKGLQAKERDIEKEKRGGIAATGSPNAFVAKPPSPSLDMLPGDLCKHQNKSRMGNHFLFPQFVPLLTPTHSMVDGESLQYIFLKAIQMYRVQHPSSYGTYSRKRYF